MPEFRPVETVADLETLDQDDVVAGYMHGWDCAEPPGSDKSRGFWHGWRNAQTDKGRSHPDVHQQRLVHEFVGSRARGH